MIEMNKQNKLINAKTKDDIKETHRLLANYGIIEDIPLEMLENGAQEKISA